MNIGCHIFKDVKTGKLYKIEIKEVDAPEIPKAKEEKKQTYYELNKDKFKEYYAKIKEDLKEKYKKEKVNKPAVVKTTCNCGSVYDAKDIMRHNTTHRHKRYLESL